MKPTETDKVLFLHNPETDDTFALFPDTVADKDGNPVSYSIIGQHSACSLEYVKKCNEATMSQAIKLYNELNTLIGYNLEVVNADEVGIEVYS